MSEKEKNKNNFRCNICNKNYSSASSLCNHNKKFHNDKCNNVQLNVQPVQLNVQHVQINVNTKKSLLCSLCNKVFNCRSSKSMHLKKCKNKINSENNKINSENNKINSENKQTELLIQLKKEEAKILKLKIKLHQSTKIDNITLNKLNKLLIERNNKIKNINTINNNTQIINNFQLVEFGKEEVVDLLTNRDKKLIINSKYCSLEKLIEIVHCGKYNQFKNIIITNMKDNYMYKYDDINGQFI